MDVRKIIAEAIIEAGFDPLAMSAADGADEIMQALGAAGFVIVQKEASHKMMQAGDIKGF